MPPFKVGPMVACVLTDMGIIRISARERASYELRRWGIHGGRTNGYLQMAQRPRPPVSKDSWRRTLALSCKAHPLHLEVVSIVPDDNA